MKGSPASSPAEKESNLPWHPEYRKMKPFSRLTECMDGKLSVAGAPFHSKLIWGGTKQPPRSHSATVLLICGVCPEFDVLHQHSRTTVIISSEDI